METKQVPTSSVRILFGAYPQKPMVKLVATLGICQKKVVAITMQQADLRQSFTQFLGTQIPVNCMVLQLEPRNGNAPELAAFMMDSRFQSDMKAAGVDIQAIPNGGKVYAVIRSEALSASIDSFGESVSVEEQGSTTNELKIQIQSENEFSTMADEHKKLMYTTDVFKSLAFEAQLVKTPAMGMLLGNILKKLISDSDIGLKLYSKLRSFNIELKFASSNTLPSVVRDMAATEATRSADYLKLMQLSELISNNVRPSLILGAIHCIFEDFHGAGQHLPGALRRHHQLHVI